MHMISFNIHDMAFCHTENNFFLKMYIMKMIQPITKKCNT